MLCTRTRESRSRYNAFSERHIIDSQSSPSRTNGSTGLRRGLLSFRAVTTRSTPGSTSRWRANSPSDGAPASRSAQRMTTGWHRQEHRRISTARPQAARPGRCHLSKTTWLAAGTPVSPEGAEPMNLAEPPPISPESPWRVPAIDDCCAAAISWRSTPISAGGRSWKDGT